MDNPRKLMLVEVFQKIIDHAFRFATSRRPNYGSPSPNVLQ